MVEEVSKQTNKRSGWTTRDIMVTAILSIALGVLFVPLTYLSGYLMTVPVIRGLEFGINFLPIILVAYIIRKPGAAFFAAMIIGLIQVPLTPWGVMMLSVALTGGVPVDVVLMIRGYKNFSLGYLMLTGAVVAFLNAMMYFIMGGLGNLSVLIQIAYIAETTISGAVLGGLLAKIIGDAVFKTGIISSNPVKG